MFYFVLGYRWLTGFPSDSDCKESACNAGDLGSIPVLGRSPGGGHDNPLQYSCLGNPMDRGAWQATVPRVAKSQTRLSDYALSPSTVLWYFKANSKGTQPIIYVYPSSTPLPFRLPHNIEQSSLCYAVDSCWLSILNIAVCTGNYKFILFLFGKFILYHFFLDSTYKGYHMIFLL